MVWIPRDGEHALMTSSWSRGIPEAKKMTAKRATPPNPARVGALRVSLASKSNVLLCSRPPTQAFPLQPQTTPRPPLGRDIILGILQNFGSGCPSQTGPPPTPHPPATLHLPPFNFPRSISNWLYSRFDRAAGDLHSEERLGGDPSEMRLVVVPVSLAQRPM